MAPTKTIRNLELYLAAFYLNFAAAFCYSFTITNNCQQTIWPGTLAGAGTPQLSTTGFQLDPGQTVNLPTLLGWSGRIWARTECEFDNTGAGKCQTGDCGGKLECSGMAAEPPTTLFEITFGKESSDYDFYDVSLVDGFNLPLVATPIEVASNSCATTGCAADLNHGCPKELEMVGDGNYSDRVVACKSACEAFGLDQYCCIGEFGNPTTCKPSFYSTIFKTACPKAYSYAFDDGSSTFTCKANNYHITFCPAADGLRRSNGLSTREPVQEYSNTDRPERTVSSGYASIVPFHSFVILILIFLL